MHYYFAKNGMLGFPDNDVYSIDADNYDLKSVAKQPIQDDDSNETAINLVVEQTIKNDDALETADISSLSSYEDKGVNEDFDSWELCREFLFSFKKLTIN